MRHAARLSVGLGSLACAFVLSGCEATSTQHTTLSAWRPTVPLRGANAPATWTAPAPAVHAYAPPPPASRTPAVVAANDATFNSELAAAGSSAVINFTAKWCAPCKAMAPTIESLAAEGTTRAKVIRIDFDESPAIVRRYGVSALPTILLVRNGVVVKRVVGFQSRENLATAFATALP